MRTFLIPEQVVLEIMAYLLTKPMREVEPAVMTLRNLKQAPVEPPVEQQA